jgi:hypothetical protein
MEPPLMLCAPRFLILCAVLVAACSPAAPQSQTYLAGQPVDLHELTAEDVARAVQITPRGDDVFFQAPPIQATKIIDLHSAGKELGITLGNVARVRFGYLFGVLNRPTGSLLHHVLFQSNFVVGNDRYAAVHLADGRALQFTVSRAPDPCVPNCFPVVEALIVAVPDDVLRANQTSGLPLTITLTNGEQIAFAGIPAYVQGYLQAVDRYRI